MLLNSNPITKGLHEYRRKEIQKTFPVLDNEDYISLYKYVNSRPEKYYSNKAFLIHQDYFLMMKDNHPDLLIAILNETYAELSLALRYLDEINNLAINENSLPKDHMKKLGLLIRRYTSLI
jgi:hypothetical protein